MKNDGFTFMSLDNSNVFQLINETRKGVDYQVYDELSKSFPLSASTWSSILNISERTMQRYKRENRKFDSIQSEKLLLIILLFNKGLDVFGDKANFLAWINSVCIALGGVKPIELLDSSFGINVVKDELIKIEHGILA